MARRWILLAVALPLALLGSGRPSGPSDPPDAALSASLNTQYVAASPAILTYSEIVLQPPSPPPVDVVVSATANSSALYVTPATTTLAANSTSPRVVKVFGLATTGSTPAAATLETAGGTPLTYSLSATYTFTVFPACGVVYYAPPKCPEVGEFLYFGGEFKKANMADETKLNITVLDALGYDFYLSETDICPNEVSYFQKLEGVYGRRDAQIVYQSNAFNSDVVTFRAGLRRRDSSSSCSFVLVAFDNAVATGTGTPMTCVQAAALADCNTGLQTWQIALIAVGAVVVAVLLAVGITLIVKHQNQRQW